ncbi:MAG: diaminopimelate decarboxylase [Gammaproteobacteria bacterium]
MQTFRFIDGLLYAEDLPLADIAERYGTPLYVYSRTAIEQQWHAYDQALGEAGHLICYAVKANSNIAILNLLAELGSGFDIVSGGELERVLEAGGKPEKIVFSGVGKTAAEMRRALQVGIKCFNVESTGELQRLNSVAAELSVTAPVSIRVNPDVDPGTHPYIATGQRQNKFGIDLDQALQVYRSAAELPHLNPIGIDCHIGSQITSLQPYADALDKILALLEQLQAEGIQVAHIDVGGGLGISYADEEPPAIADFGALLLERIPSQYEVLLEPGRSVVGNAGVLLTTVEYLKTGNGGNFAIVDAAMNDLLRPALYQAWQKIEPVVQSDTGQQLWDIVGPVCESGDFLGLQRQLGLQEGTVLAVFSAGAYGFVMSSNYNSRPRAAEILLSGGDSFVIRERETTADLFRGESLY